MGKIVRNGVEFAGSSNSAENIKYDGTTSMKDAIDETKTNIDTLNSNLMLDYSNSSVKNLNELLQKTMDKLFPLEIELSQLDSAEWNITYGSNINTTTTKATYKPLSLNLQGNTNSGYNMRITATTAYYYDLTNLNNFIINFTGNGANYNTLSISLIDEEGNGKNLHQETWTHNSSLSTTLDISSYTGLYKITITLGTENNMSLITRTATKLLLTR